MSKDKFVEFCDFIANGAVPSNIRGYLRPQGSDTGERFDLEKVDILISVATYFAGIARQRPDLIERVKGCLNESPQVGNSERSGTAAAAGIPEREAELEREMEAQAQRYQLQLAECQKKTADRDRLALQVDQLQARLKLLGDAADEAVSEMSYAVRNTLRAIYNASEGEIRF